MPPQNDRARPSEQDPAELPYYFPNRRVPQGAKMPADISGFVGQAANLRTFQGPIDSTFIQFFPRQPVNLYSSDFVQQSLARMLGFDTITQFWRPIKTDETGQIIISNLSALQFPVSFSEDFDGSALDPAVWNQNGAPVVTSEQLQLSAAGDYVRSIQSFSLSGNTPLVLTAQVGIGVGTGNSLTLGLVQSAGTISGTTNPDIAGIAVIVNGEDSTISIRNGTTDLVTTDFTPSAVSDYLQLFVQEREALLYVNGVLLLSTTTDLTTQSIDYNVFAMANNATGQIVYRVWLSTMSDVLTVGGYDPTGNKRFTGSTVNNELYVYANRYKPAFADTTNGAQLLTSAYADNEYVVNAGNYNALSLYLTFDPADSTGGTSADVLVEVSPDNTNWFVYPFPVTPSGYTLQSDGSLRYTYSGTGAQNSRRILVSPNDQYVRVGIKENGATTAGTVAMLTQQGWI